MIRNADVVIIGGGIVGLATAYSLLKKNPHFKLVVLEKEKEIARHQTSNNSGVVHSGIYYKPGSLKATNCIQGRAALLDFCDHNHIPYKKLGKLIVATKESEFANLQELENRGKANLIPDIRVISSEEVKEIEPHITALKALSVPNCHIIEFSLVAKKLVEKIREMGGEVLLERQVQNIREGSIIETSQETFHTKYLVNCAGLFCDKIAKMAMPGKDIPYQILPFRGEYYMLSAAKQDLIKGLVYPVPDPRFPFLGVHLTKMMNGKTEAGPNAVLALAREGYKKHQVNLRHCMDVVSYPGFWNMARMYWKMGAYELYRSLSKGAFLKDLQRFLPDLEKEDLLPGGAGVRAQVVMRNGKLLDDFAIIREKNMIHVLNAPSPAATASFSIGNHISSLVLN